MYSYDTITEALAGLRAREFILDFNLKENCIVCNDQRFNIDDFEIEEYYRFEGDTDPANEAIVYGIKSKTGLKGVLVSGYGISAEGMGAELAKKLNIHRQ